MAAGTAETALANAFGDGGALIRFTGDPPFCGVPGTLLGLLGAGGVELTWPGRLALGTGGVIRGSGHLFHWPEAPPAVARGGAPTRGSGRALL